MAKKVVVAEDDLPIADLLSFILRREGYEVYIAYDGGEALESIEKNLPDLVLLDIMMPVMDGWDVLKKVKEDDKLKNIPVIMLTAKGQEWDIVKGFELGSEDYVVKPFSPSELLVRIKKRLGE